MRLTQQQQKAIHKAVIDVCGPSARVRLFGSRLDDHAKGGDIDILVEIDEPINTPAELSAKLSVKIMRLCNGRKVDVILLAPNLPSLPIHEIAKQQGALL
ncbi:nucleotidyltransferase domain-containing protein [Nitrincola sp.]|uniref:nucleotidyltransferase domain-containing protein n=1 Tax=Nitrincola sp. TaxID=1926584 RepID=UPI003A8D2093